MALIGQPIRAKGKVARINIFSYIVFICVFSLGIVVIGFLNLRDITSKYINVLVF